MKAGEFVGVDGRTYEVELVRGYTVPRGLTATFYPFNPDFPAAVAALTELLPKPTVHPAVGLRYCGEEEFEWDGPGELCRWHGGCVEWRSGIDRKWRASGLEVTDAFNAGRRYEKEHGDE